MAKGYTNIDPGVSVHKGKDPLAEGPFYIGKPKPGRWVVYWEGLNLDTIHPTKASAQHQYEALLHQREIAQRASEVDVRADSPDSDLAGRPQDLALIHALVARHEQLCLEVAAKYREAYELEERIEKIELDQLPNLMMQLNIPKIPVMMTPDPAKPNFCYQVDIKIEDVIRASLPSKGAIAAAKSEDERAELIERKASAFSWLRGNNAESIIKNLLIATVPKGKDSLVEKVTALLTKLKLPFEREETVHPSTLSKHVHKTVEAGNPIPFDIFNVSVGKKARINNPMLKEEKNNGKTNDSREEYPF